MKLDTKLIPRSLNYTLYQIDHNCALRVHLVVVQFNKGSLMLTTVTKVMHCRCGHVLPLDPVPRPCGKWKTLYVDRVQV